MPGHRTNLEDFRAGRLCRIVVEIALQDDEGSPYYLAEASFESNHLIASANADSPAGAFAGATAAAGELLAREHNAARIYHDELQERLGIGYYQTRQRQPRSLRSRRMSCFASGPSESLRGPSTCSGG